MTVTLKDIAEAAGVSRAAVSLVLNGRDRELGIAPETRDLVLTVARKLGYSRRDRSRSMFIGANRTVALVNPELHLPDDYEIGARITDGIVRELTLRGYSLKIFTPEHFEPDIQERQLRENQIAGVICVGRDRDQLQATLEGLQQLRMPTILANFEAEDFGCGIVADYAGGIAQAVDHLTALGHHRIAYIGTQTRFKGPLKRRHSFHARLNRKVEGEVFEIPSGGRQKEQLLKAARLIYAAGFRAIIAENDALAAMLMQWALVRRLALPRDLSLIGFGNLNIAEWCAVPLTTVEVPFVRIGRMAAGRLIDALIYKDDAFFERCVNIAVHSPLILRQSVFDLRHQTPPA